MLCPSLSLNHSTFVSFVFEYHVDRYNLVTIIMVVSIAQPLVVYHHYISRSNTCLWNDGLVSSPDPDPWSTVLPATVYLFVYCELPAVAPSSHMSSSLVACSPCVYMIAACFVFILQCLARALCRSLSIGVIQLLYT